MTGGLINSLAAAFVCAAFFLSPAAADGVEDYIAIEKDGLRIEVTPHFGGRVTSLSLDGKGSFILFDREEAKKGAGEISPDMEYPLVLGQSVWVSPQGEWWNHQDLYPERAGDNWPPDPYLTMADVEHIEKTGDRIVMWGAESPITGAQFTQTYAVKNGGVEVVAKLRNSRVEEIAWTPWFNTRAPVEAKVYAPAASMDDMRVTIIGGETMDPPVFEIENGILALTRLPPSEGKGGRQGKAYIDASAGWMAAFHDGQVFLIEFVMQDPYAVHPEQSPVEIYLRDDAGAGYIEMERQYAVENATIKDSPFADYMVTEHWKILPYDGPDDARAHRRFLNDYFGADE